MGVKKEERQANFLRRLRKETSRYLPEIILAVVLGVSVFIIIFILIH